MAERGEPTLETVETIPEEDIVLTEVWFIPMFAEPVGS